MTHAVILALALGLSQEIPQDIPKSDLPKRAHCVVCEATGAMSGEMGVAAGVMYKGTQYYFCHAEEVAKFKASPEAFLPPVLPRPAAPFELTDTNGKVWNAEAMKDKLIVIDFWATWCAPCHELRKMLVKTRETFKDKPVEILSVSIDDDRAAFDKFVKKTSFPGPVLFDNKDTWEAWNVISIPRTFLVRDGQVVAQHTGKINQSDLDKLVASNLPSEAE